jgi:hypothetical protein
MYPTAPSERMRPGASYPVTGVRIGCLSPSTYALPRIWKMEVEELALCVCEGRTRHHQVCDIVLRPAQVVALPCLQCLIGSDATMLICLVPVVDCFGMLGIFLMVQKYRLGRG